jgi:hypothetical protein
VSLVAISSCFFASLSVTGSAVGFVTTSAINRTCETSLDHYFRLTGLNAYQPKTDWQAIPIFQKDQVHRLDHNANVTVCNIRRNARRNLTSTQASNSRDVTAGSAIAKGCNDLEEWILPSHVDVEQADLAIIGCTWECQGSTAKT